MNYYNLSAPPIGEYISHTRMHSSRMRTARLLPVSPSMHCSGGYLVPGGVPAQGDLPGPGGCTRSRGGVPAQGCTCLGGVPGPRGMYLVLGDLPGPGGMYLVLGDLPGPGGMYLVLGDLPGPGGMYLVLGECIFVCQNQNCDAELYIYVFEPKI